MDKENIEEKSLVESKGKFNIIQWFKSKFENFKEIFSFKKQVQQNNESQELTVEELDNITAGYPIQNSPEKFETKKTWVLTDEEKRIANTPIAKKDSTELSVEELDKITAGVPNIEEDERIE